MKPVKTRLVTDRGEQPALLTFGDTSADEPVLVADGVVIAPEDLPDGAYLEVDDPAVADLAVIAGYATEPPKSARRRRHKHLGRVYAVGLLAGVIGALYNVVRDLSELDLIGALLWIGIALFVGFLAAAWWFMGDDIGLDEAARHRRYSARFWRAARRLGQRKR